MSDRARREHDPPPKGLHRRLWRFLRHDVGRELLALLLAILVWLYLSNKVTQPRDIELMVSVMETRKEAEKQRNVPGIYLVVPRDIIVRDDLSGKKILVGGRGLTEHVKDLELTAILEIRSDALGTEDEITWAANLDDL